MLPLGITNLIKFFERKPFSQPQLMTPQFFRSSIACQNFLFPNSNGYRGGLYPPLEKGSTNYGLRFSIEFYSRHTRWAGFGYHKIRSYRRKNPGR